MQIFAMPSRLSDSTLHVLVVLVPERIDVEGVRPVLSTAGTLIDVTQIDP